MPKQLALTIYQGRTGDRNSRAMAGSAVLGAELSKRLNLPATYLGKPQPPLGGDVYAELEAARPDLQELGAAYDKLLAANRTLLSVTGRCAVSLGTLPVVAKHRPDVCVVWLDAHADSNTPTSTPIPYLGGVVLSATAGMWDSGLGAGLPLSQVVLVGSRDIDPDEQELIDAGAPRLVRVGPNLPEQLSKEIAGRRIYIHLDCDVLEPDIVPTEYRSFGGLTLEDLRAASEVLAQQEIIGLEIAEYEATWARDESAASPTGLLDALHPLISSLGQQVANLR